MPEKKRLAIVDGDHVMYIVCPNKKLYNKDGSPKLDINGIHSTENKTLEQCIKLADSYVNNFLNMMKADYYIGALTVGKCYRYRVKRDYKANRIGLEKPPFFKEVRDHLINKWKFVYKENDLEADDIVLKCKDHYKDTYNCFIATTDKDILMTEGTHFDPKKVQWVITSKEEAKKFFWMSMLHGDVADNIIGIPKIGPKKAEKILEKGDQFKLQEFYIESVFIYYITHFGEEEGIRQFYKNYNCLKMNYCDDCEDLVIPEVIKYE